MSTKHTVDNISKFDQLVAEIEEYNKQDKEAIARAKAEREKWLEQKKSGKQKKDQDWSVYLSQIVVTSMGDETMVSSTFFYFTSKSSF